MVEPYHIEHPERSAQAFNPPAITIPLHYVPTVKRVSPKLPGGAEIIRRDARNFQRIALFVEPEHFRIGPHVGTVMRGINGNIAHNANSTAHAMLFNHIPPAKKLKLPELIRSNFRRKLFSPHFYG